MKIVKRITGIVLMLALVLQCGQGIVIGKAANVAFTGTPVYTPNQWWAEGASIDFSVSGLNPGEYYMYEFQFVDSGGTPMTPLTGIKIGRAHV